MPSYTYRVIDPDGKEKKVRTPGVGARDHAVFCRQCATILKAGVSAINTLQMMSEQTENRALGSAAARMADELGRGETLSSAMRRERVFPPILADVVDSGESSGTLDTAFDKMAVWFEKEDKLSRTVRRATLYPLAVFGVAVCIIIAMLAFIVPNFMEMFGETDVEMPALTQAVISVSDFFVKYWWLLAIIAAVIIAAVILYSHTESGQVLFGKLKLWMPLSGRMRTDMCCAMFAGTLSTLLQSGIPMGEALEITGDSMDGNILLRRAVYDAEEQVEQGVALSKPVSMSGLFPPMVIHMISIGEETGALEDMLETIAEYYEEEASRAAEHITAVAEPVIIVILAVITGIIIMAVLQPMLTLYDSIDRL